MLALLIRLLSTSLCSLIKTKHYVPVRQIAITKKTKINKIGKLAAQGLCERKLKTKQKTLFKDIS